MNYTHLILGLAFTLTGARFCAGQSKFAQLDVELPTPNGFRTAAGAPGPSYYQQKADYKMSIRIDDETQRLYGEETIAYTNNSPDQLEYLWLQLDQNIYAQDAESKLIEVEKMEDFKSLGDVKKKLFYYDGGFKIES
ncbi:MAG: M1 family peptidase, partial [Bacteroidota bacterium]